MKGMGLQTISERAPLSVSGYLFLIFPAAVLICLTLALLNGVDLEDLLSFGLPLLVIASLLSSGFYIVQPNTARVLTFLGRYAGTDANQGLRWTIPVLIGRQHVSMRLRNFESARSKVNDATGNPIEIAGIVVWRVTSPAASVFGVDDAAQYVSIQSEAAIRALASSYPYGSARHLQTGDLTLLGHPGEIADRLKDALQERVSDAGVDIIEARISHLAYAPEIAAAMLQRQQADALVDAREVLVEGAVGIVEMALARLQEREIVELSLEQKSALVANLLVVLSGEGSAQPVIQAGAVVETPKPVE